jgi:hypothetical protein
MSSSGELIGVVLAGAVVAPTADAGTWTPKENVPRVAWPS